MAVLMMASAVMFGALVRVTHARSLSSVVSSSLLLSLLFLFNEWCFCLGVILFALMTGSLPFDDDSLPALLNKVAKGEYRSNLLFPRSMLFIRVLI